MKYPITLNVNGVAYPVDVDPHTSLLDTVREQLGLTGSKEGCDDSECGACMMLARRPADERLLLPGDPGRRARRSRPSRASPTAATCRRCSAPSSRRAACSAGSARPAC